MDGRRRIEPVGEDGMEDGGVVPNREERDELKYDEDARAGEGALIAMGEEIIDADNGLVIVLGLAVCNCS